MFEPWTPTESAVPDSMAHEHVQTAVGCKAGHPSSTLAAIIEAVEHISIDFGRGKVPCTFCQFSSKTCPRHLDEPITSTAQAYTHVSMCCTFLSFILQSD